GRDVTAALTITLLEAAKGTNKRVKLPAGREVDVKIPAGLNDGQTIRLKGQGAAGAGGRAGDLLIVVSVAPHPLVTRSGADLRLELPITLYEAVLGAKVRVPTLEGAVELAIPPDTSSGRTFRLKGKGLPAKDGKGDLLAAVRIMLPEGGDTELEELMRKWRKTKPHDPRKDMGGRETTPEEPRARRPWRDDASRPSLRRALVDLVVSRLRDVEQTLAVDGATHHVSEPVLDPIHGGEAIGRAVTHGRLRRIRACIVDRKALAGGAFIHAECRWDERPRHQPSPPQLQSALLELRDPQLVVEAFRQPLHQMRPLAAGNLDRMTHLDHVDRVGIERLRGERVEAAWPPRRCRQP